METKKVEQTKYINDNALIGVVTRWFAEESYIFVATNNFLINLPQIKAPIVRIYINNKDLKDRELIKQNDLITFKLKELSRYGQLSAKEARRITPTKEDFQLFQNYINNGQSKIEGILKTKSGSLHINADIAQFTTNLFYKNKEGRDIVIKHFIQGNCTDFDIWQQIFDNMTEEERNTFDFSQLNLTVPLRILFYSYTEDLDLIDYAEAEAFCETDRSAFVQTIRTLTDDLQYQFFQQFNEDLATEIITTSFKGTLLMKNFVEEKWNNLKSDIPYIVFDIESDGENISQFAFIKEDNLRSYTGEDQINSLIRAIKETDIVVGHNIKLWDLPILQKKGLVVNEKTFIWDTLEIEILLNPCRYAYSLYTTHKAPDDTNLTNTLFWNQLYRLSLRPELAQSLQAFLPHQITNIINSLRRDYFADCFNRTANCNQTIFHELLPPSKTFIENITQIFSLPSEKSILIIAPKNIWPRLAIFLPLSFYTQAGDNNSFKSIDLARLKQHPFSNPLKQKILERFCDESKTPIIENLPLYLRVNEDGQDKIFYSQDDLSPLLHQFTSHIDCIDIDSFENDKIKEKKYDNIFIIGDDLQDRIHKVKVCENKTLADLIVCGSQLPLSMANTSYAPILKKEYAKLGILNAKSSRSILSSSNLWAERLNNGEFAFFMNFQYKTYRNDFLKNFDIVPRKIKWELENVDINNIHITQVLTRKTEIVSRRVNFSSVQRNLYWLFQISIIKEIRAKTASLPIIYVVNDFHEIAKLSAYARVKGFHVSEDDNLFKRLETVSNHDNGMVIITKDEFLENVGMYRTDKPFCYVWDNMDIDRCMLMWRNLPFDDDIDGSTDADRDEKTYHSTPRQCIYASWPLFEHYCSLVKANNIESQFFLIDAYFDDYPDIATSCKASSFVVNLFEDEETFNEELKISYKFFYSPESTVSDITDVINIEEAMEIIRTPFIGEYQWKPLQKDILPHMLEKRGDCIISIPTGGGKSVLYQAPAIFRASISRKLSLVVTPLRALMQDQVEELREKGFTTNVDYLNADRRRPEVQAICRRILSGELALLYITPERFRVRSFINVLIERMEIDGGLEYIVFDEAHCISQWGQEFRPDYLNAVQKCCELRENGFDFMIAMFSATVTTQVENDLRSFFPNITRLGQNAKQYNPVRQHIEVSFSPTEHKDEARVENILNFIKEKNIDFSKSCLIIFCRTHRQCEEVSETLSRIALEMQDTIPDSPLAQCVERIGYYHAGLDSEVRNDIYDKFKRKEGVDPLYILCSTKAFGMGMDIGNVHYILHYNPPQNIEDYLQEVGRAGRDEKLYAQVFKDEKIPAVCLCSANDFRKLKELLIKGLLSWADLSECKKKILQYINLFQTTEQTKSSPVVVPYDIWSKTSDSIKDYTSGQLAFYWLEHIEMIKLGYTGLANLDITVLKNTSVNNEVYKYVLSKVEQTGKRTLFSIKDMRQSLHLPLPKIMNQLLILMKEKLIQLNETIRCKIHQRRFSEVRYMKENNANIFALRIIFKGIYDLLSDCGIDREVRIGAKEREERVKHLMDDFNYELKTEKKGEKIEYYMPWRTGPDGSGIRFDVQTADAFRKNIFIRAGYQIFTILDYIPMVTYKVEKEDENVIFRIRVKDENWASYVTELENDCLQMIYFVYENLESEVYNWAELMINFGWINTQSRKKGYTYFEDVLSILGNLSYIEYTSPIRSGIEIYATATTDHNIDSGEDENSPMYSYRQEFETNAKTKKIRLACMNIFSFIDDEKEQNTYIQRYFNCENYDDYLRLAEDYLPEGSDILKEINEEALKNEEKKLENNAQQVAIYNYDRSSHVNVLAGPGSGKTHILILRCARLIYREGIDPSGIMVLAYNRAVVEELRNRLNSLFAQLGLSRMAHQLNVYTFHGLAKKCLGTKLDDVPTDLWEYKFSDYLSNNSNFKLRFPNIQYVMVDEFQDITTPRLDSLIYIHKIYPDAQFFTIGDINQSIYGFDRVPKDYKGNKIHVTAENYAKLLDPKPYYERFNEVLASEQLTMFTNYRSFPKILAKASKFITEGDVPVADITLQNKEPQEEYVFEIDNTKKGTKQWYEEFKSIIKWAKNPDNQIDTIAVFFRTNNEVFRGYSSIRNILPPDVRIRIQGDSIGELWREREIYYLLEALQRAPDHEIEMNDDKTLKGIKKFLEKKMNESKNWDKYLLDVAYTLALNYVDSIRSDMQTHTWGEMSEYIKDITQHDEGGQVYKIYDNYQSERIIQQKSLTVILTTMHKVKGLEFDVVVIPPSSTSLPINAEKKHKKGDTPAVDDLADMDEERRVMYVAYTRAKKRLYIYKGERENALEENILYFMSADNEEFKYTEKDQSLKKYTLYYTAQRNNTLNDYISKEIKKNDPVRIKKEESGPYKFYIIYHNKTSIGRLSLNSDLRKKLENDNVEMLEGMFVSNIFVWTWQDTLDSDREGNTNYAKNWSPESIKLRYTYVVQIAGFGNRKI